MKKPIIIRGAGDSLWGESSGEYIVHPEKTAMHLYGHSQHLDFSMTVDFFGDNLKWFHYTDSGIAKEINKKLKKVVEDEILKTTGKKIKIKKLSWSEQGMQPEFGWNFDVIY